MHDTCEVQVLHIGVETDKALQVFVFDPLSPDLERMVWVPLSQVHSIHRTDNMIEVSQWFAEKEDL